MAICETATRRRLSKFWIVTLTCVVLLLGGILVGSVRPPRLGWTFGFGEPEVVADLGPPTRLPTAADMQMQAKQLPTPNFAPDFSSMTLDPRFARYDNVVVEVKPDGALWVLGEQMGMEAFRSLLDDQIHNQARTYVTIRPDENCAYRHIGQVISACREVGVPHQMVAVPSVQTATISSAEPS